MASSQETLLRGPGPVRTARQVEMDKLNEELAESKYIDDFHGDIHLAVRTAGNRLPAWH